LSPGRLVYLVDKKHGDKANTVNEAACKGIAAFNMREEEEHGCTYDLHNE
jgi:hypothetical protein